MPKKIISPPTHIVKRVRKRVKAEIPDLPPEKVLFNATHIHTGVSIGRTEKKLANEKFISKAPPEVVENERGKLAGYEEKKAALAERLRYLAAL